MVFVKVYLLNWKGYDVVMKIKTIEAVKSKEEARQFAIDWQNWVSGKTLSYGELAQWEEEFKVLGRKFDLLREFKENGIL
jgi:hypothetical protein